MKKVKKAKHISTDKMDFFSFRNVTRKKTMSRFYRKIQGTQITFNICL